MTFEPDPVSGGGGGVLYGLDAAKPVAPADTTVYVATDTNIMWQFQGGVWTRVQSPSYTNAAPTTAAVGGIAAGTTFLNQTPKAIFDSLFYPYLPPAFTAFSCDCGNVVEVGTNIAGARVFAFTWTNPANVRAPPAPNGFYLRDTTLGADLEVAQPLASPINHVLGAPSTTVYHVDATNTYRIQGTNTLAAVFNTTFTVHWHWLYFAGNDVNVVLTEALIEALGTSALSDTGFRTYVFGAAATYKYVCYPAVWPAATTFTDAGTMLNVPFNTLANVNVTNVNGDLTAYRVYRSTNIINAAINIIVA